MKAENVTLRRSVGKILQKCGTLFLLRFRQCFLELKFQFIEETPAISNICFFSGHCDTFVWYKSLKFSLLVKDMHKNCIIIKKNYRMDFRAKFILSTFLRTSDDWLVMHIIAIDASRSSIWQCHVQYRCTWTDESFVPGTLHNWSHVLILLLMYAAYTKSTLMY